MVTARRLYLYGVLATSLVVLLVGLQSLLRLPIATLSDGLSGGVLDTASGGDRDDLALAIAMVAVGGPLWAAHAWMLGRTTRGSPRQQAEELAAPSRAVYFTLILGGLLAFGVVALGELLSSIAWLIRHVPSEWEADLAGPAATALVAGIAWPAHLAWRAHDLRRAPDRLSGDWLTRGYVYGALAALAVTALFQGSETLSTALRLITGRADGWGEDAWWQASFIRLCSMAGVAAVAWAVHWRIADRLCAAPDPMGPAHRQARTRVGYLLGLVLVSVSMVCLLAANTLRELLGWVLGAWRIDVPMETVQDIIGTLVVAIPWGIAWWWHRRCALREAGIIGGPDRRVAVERTARSVVALVGAAAVAAGLMLTIDALLQAAGLGTSGPPSGLRGELADALATLSAGLVLWLPAWTRLQRRRASDPVTEATATARRAYLLLISGVSVVAVLGSGAWLVYQALRNVMDVRGDAGSVDSAGAMSMLIVAGVGLAYHLAILRSDGHVGHVATAADGADRMVEVLQLTGPVDADLDALAGVLRAQLPTGFSLDALGPAHLEPAAADRRRVPAAMIADPLPSVDTPL